MTEKQKIIALLNHKPHVLFAYLFGSRVKGYSSETSDWDLAIFLDVPEKRRGWSLFELEAELSREIGANIQITDLNQALTPLLGYEIICDGELLIDKDEAVRLEVVSRVLAKYLDWAYYHERHMESAGLSEHY